MKSSLILSIVLTIVCVVKSEDVHNCPNMAKIGMKDFNLTKFIESKTNWIELKSYPNQLDGYSCIKSVVGAVNESAGIIDIKTTAYNKEKKDHKDFTGEATQDSTNKAKFSHKKDNLTDDYYIIGTDYETYSSIYSCKQDEGQNATESAWILSHNSSLSDDLMKTILKLFDDLGSDSKRFKETLAEPCSGATNATLSLSLFIAFIYFIVKVIV